MGIRASKEDTEYNLKESVKYLEKARILDSNNPKIINDLANSYILLGQHLRAIKKSKNNKE